jgi:VWFA-related protein
MTRSSHCVAGIFLVLVCTVWSFGQSSSVSQSGPARIVSIPVTVMNKSGEPVPGLNASSFSLSQDGGNPTLESVSEVAPITVGKRKAKVAFVVLDAIGSTSERQGETRKECLQLLADAVTNESPISLSEIDHDGLHVVHELGTPNSILVSALLQLDKENGFLAHPDQLRAMDATAEDKTLVAAETDRLRRFRHGTIERSNMMGTLLTQLKAFQEMAIALQHAHGRKTVIWLTSYFPIDINEVEGSINVNSYGITSGFPVKSATIDYQRTIDLLNDAQISVFPAYLAADLRTTIVPGQRLGDQRTPVGLGQIAQSTGGELMVFSSALQDLVKRAEDRSTTYYLMTFHPEVPKNGPKWTRLRVQLSEKSLDVKAPRGVFVFSPTK